MLRFNLIFIEKKSSTAGPKNTILLVISFSLADFSKTALIQFIENLLQLHRRTGDPGRLSQGVSACSIDSKI